MGLVDISTAMEKLVANRQVPVLGRHEERAATTLIDLVHYQREAMARHRQRSQAQQGTQYIQHAVFGSGR